MPLWLYTLGKMFTTAAAIEIPFLSLIGNLFLIIVPCIAGIFVVKYYPKAKNVVLKIAKPLILFVLISALGLTIYSKYYVFQLINPRQWLVAPFIPWTGCLLGAFVAWCARLEAKQIRTIAIEIAIQVIANDSLYMPVLMQNNSLNLIYL
jgi:hypothetical protein